MMMEENRNISNNLSVVFWPKFLPGFPNARPMSKKALENYSKAVENSSDRRNVYIYTSDRINDDDQLELELDNDQWMRANEILKMFGGSSVPVNIFLFSAHASRVLNNVTSLPQGSFIATYEGVTRIEVTHRLIDVLIKRTSPNNISRNIWLISPLSGCSVSYHDNDGGGFHQVQLNGVELLAILSVKNLECYKKETLKYYNYFLQSVGLTKIIDISDQDRDWYKDLWYMEMVSHLSKNTESTTNIWIDYLRKVEAILRNHETILVERKQNLYNYFKGFKNLNEKELIGRLCGVFHPQSLFDLGVKCGMESAYIPQENKPKDTQCDFTNELAAIGLSAEGNDLSKNNNIRIFVKDIEKYVIALGQEKVYFQLGFYFSHLFMRRHFRAQQTEQEESKCLFYSYIENFQSIFKCSVKSSIEKVLNCDYDDIRFATLLQSKVFNTLDIARNPGARVRLKRSEVDKSRMISDENWVVSLVRKVKGAHKEHAFLVLEGQDETHALIYFIDFVGNPIFSGLRDGIVRMETRKKELTGKHLLFSCEKKMMDVRKGDLISSTSWNLSKENAEALLRDARTSQEKPPKFNLLGNKSLFAIGTGATFRKSTGHNCFTWARERLRNLHVSSIAIPDDTLIEYAFSRTSHLLEDPRERVSLWYQKPLSIACASMVGVAAGGMAVSYQENISDFCSLQ